MGRDRRVTARRSYRAALAASRLLQRKCGVPTHTQVRAHAIVVMAVLGACAHPTPPAPPTRALYRDLERLVTLTQSAGWSIDRLEIEGLLAESLDSVCRVEPARRDELRAWLDAEIARAGGPADQAWRRHDRRLSRIKRLMTLTRIRGVLDRAMTAAADDCPFWLEPEPDFGGRQISDHRWEVSFGSGGKTNLVRQGGRDDVSFGAASRILAGRVLGAHSALYAGLEMGLAQAYPKDAQGMRSPLVLGFTAVVPAVYRHTFTNVFVEAEAGMPAPAPSPTCATSSTARTAASPSACARRAAASCSRSAPSP
jgi:hypothetical protein